MDDWEAPWMQELPACGWLARDYVVLGRNASLDAWLPRLAEYLDFRGALHLLLMIDGGENPESVIEAIPHDCPHVQVTAGAQLA